MERGLRLRELTSSERGDIELKGNLGEGREAWHTARCKGEGTERQKGADR